MSMTGFKAGNQLHTKIDYKLRHENRFILHPQGLRRCRECRDIKPLDLFSIKGKNGQKNGACKQCERTRLADLRRRKKLDPEWYCRGLVASLRHRAKSENVAFNLPPGYLYALWIAQEGLCYYTGKRLDLEAQTESKTSPHLDFPSIDRLIPSEGYSIGNLVWCCWEVNRAKNSLTDDQFIKMCKIVAERLG